METDRVSPTSEACEECGSRELRVVDGLLHCIRGHRQSNTQVTAEDEGDYGTQGKITRIKKDKAKIRIAKVYRGPKAFRLYLQAYQLIIWKQSHALIHEKHFPEEVWSIIRDLWTLRLEGVTERLNDDANVPPATSGTESDALTMLTTDIDSEAERPRKQKSAKEFPTLIQTIAICYIGLLMLRQPLRLKMLHKWIMEEDLVFIRAIRAIPVEMRERMPAEYHEALDTNSILHFDDLQKGIYETCLLYSSQLGISVPTLNRNLILFDYIRLLTLPIELFGSAIKLQELLELPIEYPETAKQRRGATSYPEVRLMALLVITVQLLYPFDSETVRRYPDSPDEPACLRMSWQDWLAARKDLASSDKSEDIFKKGHGLEIDGEKALDMSGEEMDKYLAWYQQTWIKTDQEPKNMAGVGKEILDQFPLTRSTSHAQRNDVESSDASIEDALKRMHVSLKSQRHVPETEEASSDRDLLRPGMKYVLYASVDGMPETMAEFYKAAAEEACISVKGLFLAVRSTESKMQKWQRGLRSSSKRQSPV